MRRKAGALVPLELAICLCALQLRRRGSKEFHGYEMAKRLGDVADRKLLTAYGTLYRALGRLEEMGLMRSRREDPQIAARENRPGRRLYTLTAAADIAIEEARKAASDGPTRRLRPKSVPA
jgi:PadR family transcriptional regulator